MEDDMKILARMLLIIFLSFPLVVNSATIYLNHDKSYSKHCHNGKCHYYKNKNYKNKHSKHHHKHYKNKHHYKYKYKK
jgi:hypothetical protein